MDNSTCVRSSFNWLQDAADLYHTYLIERANPIVMEWSLISIDRIIPVVLLTYLLFVTKIGPHMMKDRKPFDLRWLMVPYNAALVIFNFYIFMEFAKIRWFTENETGCNTLEFTTNPNTYRLAEITWWFYISKYVELTDTIFFVLRKKDRQLSRLHLIHHSTVPYLVWAMLRSEPGGYNSFFPLANSFVHCVMYSYYGIAALGDDVKIHLFFKKYITMTQLIQFILVLSYFLTRPFYGCQTSGRSLLINVFIAGFFLVLFLNFYWHEYVLRQQQAKDKLNNHVVVTNGKVKCK